MLTQLISITHLASPHITDCPHNLPSSHHPISLSHCRCFSLRLPHLGGFVIGPSHALMDSSEAMDLHSQAHQRNATGPGLAPPPTHTTSPPGATSVLSRFAHAVQRLLGRQPNPTTHAATATAALSNDHMHQVRGAV